MRTYEVVFVAVPTLGEEDLNALVEQMKKSAESKNGRVVKVDPWGKRSLAYPIKKFKEGYYTVFTLEDNGEAVAELERRFRVTDSVIRFLSVRVDEDLKRQQKIKTEREKKKAQRGRRRGAARSVAQEVEGAQME
ncbi:MAG: 30S ribosomal protein S6 [Acidobacteria bacterium]|nr:30S ribosomal protein S6 [Acidobacteriota bacterium]